jgi:hypothetical protein
MRLNSEELRELYQRETTRADRRGQDDCLTEDQLARTVAGELSQSERERTADHLTRCSDCVKEYRAISSLKSWAEEVTKESSASSSPNGNGGRIQLTAPPSPIAAGSSFPASRSFSFYFPYAVAAAAVILSLTLAAILISKSRENQRLVAQVSQEQSARSAGEVRSAESLAEARRLRDESARRAEQESAARRIAEDELVKRDTAARSSGKNLGSARERTTDQIASPDINVSIFDLVPQDGDRGDQDVESTTIDLPPDTDLFTLILNLSGDQSSRNYSLEITDRTNRIIWRGSGLRKSAYNNFSIALRRRSFPQGEYRLKLYGLSDGSRKLIEQYAIRLAYR